MKIAWLFVWLTLALVMVIPVYPTAMVGLDAQDCHDDSENCG
jgi:hypothetical protein